MARKSAVRGRVDRILDESRSIPTGMTARNWMALTACAVPLTALAAALQFAPRAQAQFAPPQPVFVPAAQTPGAGRGPVPMLNAVTAPAFEQQLQTNPEDLNARTQLVQYYFRNNLNAQRVAHIEWVIQHHPESPVLRLPYFRVQPQGAHNDAADFEAVAQLWRVQSAAHPSDPAVAQNAAAFFNQSGSAPAAPTPAASGAPSDPYSVAALPMPTNFIGAPQVPPLLSSPAPIYPPEALAAGISGTVELLVTLGPDGHPHGLSISSGPMPLMKAAMTAVWQWIWAPYMQNGSPQIVSFFVSVPFGAESTHAAFVSNASADTAPIPLIKRAAFYPASARAAGVSGKVEIYVTVGVDGKIDPATSNPKILKSLGPDLDDAALQAVLGWQFRPAIRAGLAVAQPITVEVIFSPR